MGIVNILLILAFVIEPIIWIYAVDAKFERKYKNKMIYAGYILLDFIVSCIEEFTQVSKTTGELFFTMLFMAYMFGFICCTFKEKVYKKLLYSGILMVISLISDIIVFVIFSILGINTEVMSKYGTHNAFAMLISKLILLILIMLVNRKKLSINRDLMIGIGAILVMELPSVVMFTTEKTSNLFLINYMISQVAIVFLFLYFKNLIVNKKRMADEAMERATRLEKETKEAIERAAELEIETERTVARLKELEEQAKEARKQAIELERQLNTKSEMIEIFENRKKVLLNTNDIMYAEKVDRKVTIKTKNSLHKVNKSITYLEEQLGQQFIRISQGILVNKEQIERIDGESLFLNSGEAFHIPRERAKDIKEGLRKEMI